MKPCQERLRFATLDETDNDDDDDDHDHDHDHDHDDDDDDDDDDDNAGTPIAIQTRGIVQEGATP